MLSYHKRKLINTTKHNVTLISVPQLESRISAGLSSCCDSTSSSRVDLPPCPPLVQTYPLPHFCHLLSILGSSGNTSSPIVSTLCSSTLLGYVSSTSTYPSLMVSTSRALEWGGEEFLCWTPSPCSLDLYTISSSKSSSSLLLLPRSSLNSLSLVERSKEGLSSSD